MNYRIQPLPLYSPLYKSLDNIAAKSIPINNQQATNAILISDTNNSKKQKRSINVSGLGEQSLPPDKVKLVILVKSVKENIEEAKLSVNRRFEYIFQTLRKHRVPDALIFVSKTCNRIDGKYEVINEISANFDDFTKFQQVFNVLNEKLDSKVVNILQPIFYHSQYRIDALKHQASIRAVKNAKKLAHEIANSFHLLLGKPIEINEESSKETIGIDYNYVNENQSLIESNHKSMSQLIDEKTIKFSVNLNVRFELVQSKKHKQTTEEQYLEHN